MTAHAKTIATVTVWFVMALLPNGLAFAWGVEGHQVVALVAEKALAPKARAEVDRLLALEPGTTLASVSTWADEHRSPQTAPWHYVNFPRGNCIYQSERDCPDGRCVVAAIDAQSKVLASGAADDERLLALKYLVHFVGDVHQPLHAGYQDDKGGNTYQLQIFMRGSNLHAVWDSGLIKYTNEDAKTIAGRLTSTNGIAAAVGVPWTSAQAAQESCRIVETPGFYPGRLVDAAYIEQFKPVMERRLALAGARLAELLNRLLK
jgi:hypothetical protein